MRTSTDTSLIRKPVATTPATEPVDPMLADAGVPEAHVAEVVEPTPEANYSEAVCNALQKLREDFERRAETHRKAREDVPAQAERIRAYDRLMVGMCLEVAFAQADYIASCKPRKNVDTWVEKLSLELGKGWSPRTIYSRLEFAETSPEERRRAIDSGMSMRQFQRCLSAKRRRLSQALGLSAPKTTIISSTPSIGRSETPPGGVSETPSAAGDAQWLLDELTAQFPGFDAEGISAHVSLLTEEMEKVKELLGADGFLDVAEKAEELVMRVQELEAQVSGTHNPTGLNVPGQ